MTTTSAAPQTQLSKKQLRKVVFGGSAGVFVEFFDYGIYGFLASTIALVFFPPTAPTAGIIMTWGIFALTFLVRPIGGLVIGSIADRIGRRPALVLSLTLMSGATVGIGLLPGYAVIGVAAPILLLLLRLIQGFSAGGEVASAYSFVAENAPNQSRGFLTSLPQVGSYLAMLCGTSLGVALATFLPAGSLEEWAWRVPFLVAAPLGLLGFWIRRSLDDTVAFLETKKNDDVAHNPLAETIRDKSVLRKVFFAVALALLNSSGYYILFNYMPSFLTREFGFTTGNGLAITSLSIVVMLVAMPTLARLSDRIGRKPVMLAAAATSAIAAIPGYALASTGDFGLAVLGAALMALCFAGHSALIAVCLVELFPTRVRGTAYSLGYNIATAIFGGAAPLVMTSLIAATGQTAIPAYYVVLTAVGSGIAALFMNDGARKPIQ
ncbi:MULTISPECIES: MFS transporter [Microbacterium]|uniref:MFS transporter n=1 Tax=Microbacterium TaxID=33882 RepID=UPI00277D724A|nr:MULTISPECIES: MFS transporter [Microbacterium]MDQ1082395.1 MHS family proline/betaine transporter-like MFS transporter [Microbacterium sp. SORGH_AS_0344]MDQ1168834.1 MHS family proline/betaine transporter-like MFS transporter [Microbacterium proteolyticum]